ncbi:hypothetical protein AB1282_00445 [Gottfriedia sp. S16(2024)]|uniref:hypothetical protein n=1 Tax=Gottfriedia sp. S16(2024) TaxID=3162883 RepID=UPI003D1FB34F
MGRSVDMNVGDYGKIREELVTVGVKDEPFLDEILLAFGHKSGSDYFLLNNEYWEDYNSYYNVSTFIDRYYGVKDSFYAFLRNMTEATANMCIYEAAAELGVELPESEDDE